MLNTLLSLDVFYEFNENNEYLKFIGVISNWNCLFLIKIKRTRCNNQSSYKYLCFQDAGKLRRSVLLQFYDDGRRYHYVSRYRNILLDISRKKAL